MAGVVGGGAIVAAGAALSYSILRPYFKSSVNCHFCNTYCKVPYPERNSWTCSVCDQYNGFGEDGDYNKPIHHMDSIATSFAINKKPKNAAENGLCRTCNLNQELKISQLSSFSGDGAELEDYRAHLERVYRLCGDCVEVVNNKLSEQDAKLTPWIIAHKLETSRLSSVQSLDNEPSRVRGYLCNGQVLLSVALFFVILNPGLNLEPFPFYLTSIGAQAEQYLLRIQGFVATALALVSLGLVRVKPLSVLCLLPLLVHMLGLNHLIQLTLAFICVSVVLLAPVSPASSPKPVKKRSIIDTISARFMEHSQEDRAETVSEGTDSSGSKSTVSKSFTSLVDRSPETLLRSASNQIATSANSFLSKTTQNLFAPAGLFAPAPTKSTPGPRFNSSLLRSGDCDSFNHEFSTDNGRDCDLSSLTLGEEEPSRPASAGLSPFSPRLYSPAESPGGIKFAPGRPVLRPSRLTSWVAGGYWTPPLTPFSGEPISRSSSQSSGFVSASGPSVQNFPISHPPNYASLPSSPVNSFFGDCDRCSVLSEPLMKGAGFGPSPNRSRGKKFIIARRSTLDDDLSDSSLDRASQDGLTKLRPKAESSQLPKETSTPLPSPPPTLNDKLSLTVTITPVGVVLAVSLALNMAVAYHYLA